MKLLHLLMALGLLLILLLSHCCAPTEARRLIFYNPHSQPLKSQLLVSRKLSRPCPQGKMRDHRDRCRRAVIFGRSR